MLAPVRWQAGVLAVVVVALIAVAFLIGRGTADKDSGAAESATPGSQAPFAILPTRKCRTQVGYSRTPTPLTATTRAALPASVAGGLVAYRDSAGTTLIAPKGWECRAIIGVDGGENVSAFPPGEDNPAEYPAHSDTVVSLQLTPACQGCIAEAVCALFPNAKVAQDYAALGTHCPPKPLREQVTHISPATVLYVDPPRVKGTGTGSGGSVPSIGALSFSHSLGARKVSCTLPAEQAEACAGIVSATLLAAPLY